MAFLLALAAVATPTASVLACSCAGFATPADAARSAAGNGNLGFIGTVVGARPAPPDPNGFGETVAYAFSVDRATAPVAGTIEVRALNDPGGASCGFVFGMHEEWFVTASSSGGALHTGLCEGNQRLDTMDEAAVEELATLLPEQPTSDGDGSGGTQAGDWLPIAALAGVLVLLGGAMVVAFRRGGIS